MKSMSLDSGSAGFRGGKGLGPLEAAPVTGMRPAATAWMF